MNVKLMAGACMFVASLGVLQAPRIEAAETPKDAPPKWDYRIIQEAQLLKEGGVVFEKDAPVPTPDQALKNQETALKKLGDAGWELTSVITVDKHDVMKTLFHVFYFKRPKPADALPAGTQDPKK